MPIRLYDNKPDANSTEVSTPTRKKLAVSLQNIKAANEIVDFINATIGGIVENDVTDHNDDSVLYVVGDAYTEGSIRITQVDGTARVEKMDLGVWNLAEFEVSAGTLLLGPNIRLSALGEHLQVGSVEGNRQAIVPDAFFDETGSAAPHTGIMGVREDRVIYQPDNSLEVLSTTHTNVVDTNLGSIAYSFYGQLGAVPPTGVIEVDISAGIPPNDTSFFRRLYNTAGVPPYIEVALDLVTGLSFELSKHTGVLDQINVKAETLNGIPWSLKYNAAGTRPWFALDLQPITFEPLFSMPTGFNRLLSDQTGETLFDKNGNMIASGTA